MYSKITNTNMHEFEHGIIVKLRDTYKISLNLASKFSFHKQGQAN